MKNISIVAAAAIALSSMALVPAASAQIFGSPYGGSHGHSSSLYGGYGGASGGHQRLQMPSYGTGPNMQSESVDGYMRNDGGYVMPHQRSAPDSSINNNWSTKGNSNPYTGARGTRRGNPHGGW